MPVWVPLATIEFAVLDGPGSSMSSFNGMVVVPTGPGLGMNIDPDFVDKHMVEEAW